MTCEIVFIHTFLYPPVKYYSMSTEPMVKQRIDEQTRAYVGVLLYFLTIVGGVMVFYTLTTVLLSTVGIEAAPLPL